MNVFIFHGTFGYPEENWFPWLKRQMENQGIKTYVPKFPTPKGQSLTSWLKAFKPYEKYIDKETIFVGHSLGPVFILRLLEKRKEPVLASILVAPFNAILSVPEFDELNKTFIEKPFNWQKIKQNCKHFVVFRGSDDPYISADQPEKMREALSKKIITQGKRLANRLNVDFKEIKKGGHFNTKAGYSEFFEVLTEINRLLFSGKKEKWLLAKQKN